ncbi:glycosyltransferase [Salinibacterium sp. G-O1]|uniref:glycosyltransferase n=1 Tax=Salinibacterium sp. G-O1 TaxID=3046208 RepID=UPI0024B960AF|nr:glycosyltransferase [Salinibacterium sp. G-O1]MDJ0336507.1 glycosyltransferase [Salinibacterium sp. G-O1]
MHSHNPPAHQPRVTVLLATFNGRRWLPDQVTSILNQRGVAVRVVIMDDGSVDGTVDWINDLASREPRVTVLPADEPSGSAAANFYRLIERADTHDADLVALADQDDIWVPDKLERHAELILARRVAAVSSSITSFDADGRRTLVRKSYPQRRFDYLTESPGPGSTFLMTPAVVALVRDVLRDDPLARTAEYHDSLIYAIVRARGWGWHIDAEPTVDYRQHENNVMGSNVGGAPALARLRLIQSKWHRQQALIHAEVGLKVASDATRPGLQRMNSLMADTGVRSRLALAATAGSLRRRPRDRFVIGALIACGVW